ncbi:glycogen debranching protein GlgX [soil metagenome]
MTTTGPGPPLGAHWDGAGTTVALWAPRADAVEVCRYDDAGAEIRSWLPERTGGVRHGYLPGVGPGQRYGVRVHGPDSNPAKLLIDPYARAIEGAYQPHEAVLDRTSDLDSAPHVPRGVVVDDRFDWSGDRPPRVPWEDTVLYELHVRGFTMRHPDVPEGLRGTYAGLAHPAAIGHLTDLGVTSVQLLPVQHFVSEPRLLARGLSNYWGYNTLGFFAPHAGYASGSGPVAEFKAMVAALHAAGLEVILDVVYNHTAEGDEHGPTLSFRGIDEAAYYRRDAGGRYDDMTGCGNTLDTRRPQVLALVLDSLRYWVGETHIDGFRFDLATALVRGSAFLAAVEQDPVLSQVKLIAEPWDLGEDGYRVGRFPPPWTEWNDQYRNTVRHFWAGGNGGVRELGYRLSGSSDLYPDRRPHASVNYVTAHDGFTLRDLVSYQHKHNQDNGEDNRDGEEHNRSWNCGAEGESTDPAVLALRRRQTRNLLATLLLSAGVPMLTAGDELRRTQRGNNNAYCQDNEPSYLDWDLDAEARALRDWTARLIALRQASPVLRRQAFFDGHELPGLGVKDLAWFTADGREMTAEDWYADTATIAMYLDGRGQPEQTEDRSYLVILHAGEQDTTARLPGPPWATGYELVFDTADDEVGAVLEAGSELAVTCRSVVLLRCRHES